jgi:hypothetical protein
MIVPGTWVIDGLTGFEQLRLGEDRSAVRARFGDFRVFRRTPEAPATDYFIASGIQVTYDGNGRVEFIEVMAPADPVLRGSRLLGRPAEDVIADLRVRGVECHEDRDGAYLPDWRVGLFAIAGIVEGVSINDSRDGH